MVKGESEAGSGAAVSVKAFDPEFAFYGPVAFDLGALYANYLIAAARACALGDEEHMRWTLALPQQPSTAFEEEFRRQWPNRVAPRVCRDHFVANSLDAWRCEAGQCGAANAARRTVPSPRRPDIGTVAH